jgi:hypothetical protein
MAEELGPPAGPVAMPACAPAVVAIRARPARNTV